MIGMIFEMQSRIDEAKRTYERVVELDPRAAVASNNLAWIYAEHGGNLDLALQLAQAASAVLPDNGQVSDTLGWVYLKKGLGSLAVPAFQRAVENEPSNAIFHYHLGLAYVQGGDKDRARQSLQTVLKLRPNPTMAADATKALSSL